MTGGGEVGKGRGRRMGGGFQMLSGKRGVSSGSGSGLGLGHGFAIGQWYD